VGGWNPNQYRIYLNQILGQRSVDGIIVFVYLGNDIVSKRIEHYQPRQHAPRHSLKLPAGFAWSDWKEAVFYPINDALEVRSHLFMLLKNQLQYELMRLGLSDHYFPKALLASQTASNVWHVTGDILEEIALAGESHGLQTVFVMIPSITEANPADAEQRARAFGIDMDQVRLDQPHERLGAELRRRNLITVDTTAELRAAIADQTPDVYGQVDQHLGTVGHQVVARSIEDKIWQAFRATLEGA
jgi:hypothetical protein